MPSTKSCIYAPGKKKLVKGENLKNSKPNRLMDLVTALLLIILYHYIIFQDNPFHTSSDMLQTIQASLEKEDNLENKPHSVMVLVHCTSPKCPL